MTAGYQNDHLASYHDLTGVLQKKGYHEVLALQLFSLFLIASSKSSDVPNGPLYRRSKLFPRFSK